MPLGCNKDADKAAARDPQFDKSWADLEKGGAEPLFIEGELHGAGLMGEVRRAVEPSRETSPIAKQPLSGPLPDNEVVKVIRANLAAVKGCYQIEERAGTVSSGKAIVTLEIGGDGSVANVRVDAPAFSASKLPQCVSGRAKSWTFPRFTAKEPKRFSYPFVFVGG
ncbi:MAG TPA: AgmX/PglI C-terminal domain-containing protein [Kofleriaceae bacterium]|nr:AgmX/PglI C-terminal domain-containing protein [Kofleriaceae bacterium]